MPVDYEKLGLFYLGRQYDLAAAKRRDDFVLYDSKDLVTHAVCVGMTGSGKTGLGIGLIEEAALDGVPVLAIDPKGDLANLLLTFPSLAPADFRPWVDPADAAARGLSPDQLAEQQAATWQKGLADWDQTPARIARLRETAAVRVLTPGSRAGTPLALLRSLRPPADESDEDSRTRITSTAASLLALAGYSEMGPHDRELTFVSAVLAFAGSAPSADLPWLVQQIQRPSFDRVGVLDLETYYPAKERQELALRFNSVLASPGFDVWLDGVPLDVGAMLHDAAGRPTITVVSIAHLGDAERMLVVSLVLNALLEWTRRQTGTGSLRAMLYMDEVFGYLPPVSNPPSKPPLLTLLKQARAFGVGIVLATQNPVDLDYKALSNTGTWFLGKLQTERDKARVLDGLEGVAGGLDRATLDKTLSALRSRVFLMHNVHDAAPVVFETRWTLSYLRGPMGRDEIRRATGGWSGGAAAAPAAAAATTSVAAAPAVATVATPRATVATSAVAPATDKPVLPAAVREFYLPAKGAVTRLTPVLYGAARVHYTDAKRNIDTVQDLRVTVPFGDGAVAIDWDHAEPTDATPDDLLGTPPASAGPVTYGVLPPAGRDPRSYTTWTRDFEQWVVRAERLAIYSAPSLKLTSQAGESERDFRVRVQQASREARDAAVQKLRDSYAPKVARLTQRVQTASDAVLREEQQASQQKTQTIVSAGAAVLGALFGRKAISVSNLGRATTAARGVGRAMKENEDIARAQAKQQQAEAELKALEAEISEEVAALSAGGDSAAAIETIEITPKRGAVDVRLVALAWLPE
jgi:hypothetical protein